MKQVIIDITFKRFAVKKSVANFSVCNDGTITDVTNTSISITDGFIKQMCYWDETAVNLDNFKAWYLKQFEENESIFIEGIDVNIHEVESCEFEFEMFGKTIQINDADVMYDKTIQFKKWIDAKEFFASRNINM